MKTMHWRTDAASGQISAESAEAALMALIGQNEWAPVDSLRENRDIEDGAWITIFDEEGVPVLSRGQMP